MLNTNAKYNTIGLLGGIAGLIVAGITFLSWLENREHKDVKADLLILDREIKQLQLEKEKSQVVQVTSSPT